MAAIINDVLLVLVIAAPVFILMNDDDVDADDTEDTDGDTDV